MMIFTTETHSDMKSGKGHGHIRKYSIASFFFFFFLSSHINTYIADLLSHNLCGLGGQHGFTLPSALGLTRLKSRFG